MEQNSARGERLARRNALKADFESTPSRVSPCSRSEASTGDTSVAESAVFWKSDIVRLSTISENGVGASCSSTDSVICGGARKKEKRDKRVQEIAHSLNHGFLMSPELSADCHVTSEDAAQMGIGICPAVVSGRDDLFNEVSADGAKAEIVASSENRKVTTGSGRVEVETMFASPDAEVGAVSEGRNGALRFTLKPQLDGYVELPRMMEQNVVNPYPSVDDQRGFLIDQRRVGFNWKTLVLLAIGLIGVFVVATIVVVVEFEIFVGSGSWNGTVIPQPAPPVPGPYPRPFPSRKIWHMNLRDFDCSDEVIGFVCVSDERGLCILMKKLHAVRPKTIPVIKIASLILNDCSGFDWFKEI